MSRSGGKQTGSWGVALAVVALAGLVAAPGVDAQQRDRGRTEFRIPIRKADKRRIPVVMVSPDQVRMPARNPRGELPPPMVPAFGGGYERPPQQRSPQRGPSESGRFANRRQGSSLFDQVVGGAPVGSPTGSTADRGAPAGFRTEPAADHSIDLYSPSEPRPTAQGPRVRTLPADGSETRSSFRNRPVVKVIGSGSGTIHVLPPGSTSGAVEGSTDGSGVGSVRGASLAPTAGGGYTIGPGDAIDVFVWRNPELSRTVPVRPDGLISLPLVGEIVATGKTAEQLQLEIADLLAEYVQMPDVTVTVAEINSLEVYVLGNVNSPGTVTMNRNLTVLQAIAMAGGLNEFADRNDIVVLRTDASGVQRRFTFRYGDVVGGEDLSTNLSLRAGDVIYVP